MATLLGLGVEQVKQPAICLDPAHSMPEHLRPDGRVTALTANLSPKTHRVAKIKFGSKKNSHQIFALRFGQTLAEWPKEMTSSLAHKILSSTKMVAKMVKCFEIWFGFLGHILQQMKKCVLVSRHETTDYQRPHQPDDIFSRDDLQQVCYM